ncbi:MAG TPA: DNA polymerase III subunit delta [Sulfurivirga caldicuralii]|nr:DNA polymerase III subunit delta [Sulfurivirga caldicuralii]
MISAEAFLKQPALAPMLLLHGEEPYYQLKVGDQVRALAREQGLERVALQVGADTDWARLLEQTREVGLFSRGELIELSLPSAAPGREGSAFFRQWALQPPPDTVLFVISGRLEARQQQSAWVQAFAQTGLVIAIQPPRAHQLPQWCQARAQEKGLNLTLEAAALLAERTEGNLLAADQALEIMRLRYGEGARIDLAQVQDNVVDQAHYALFALSDRILAGETAEALHVLERLLEEGEAIQLVIWLLAREIRVLYQLAAGCQTPQQIFQAARIWASRQRDYQQAHTRHPASGWASLLAQLALADRQAKGQAPGQAARTLAEVIVRATTFGSG